MLDKIQDYQDRHIANFVIGTSEGKPLIQLALSTVSLTMLWKIEDLKSQQMIAAPAWAELRFLERTKKLQQPRLVIQMKPLAME